MLSIPNFANPVQFICGGSFDTAAGNRRPTTTGAPNCAGSGWVRCCAGSANYPPFLFHPLNTITAYKGQIIYDTPATQAKAETPVPS